ncbi:Arf-GAP with GTPase, ANK repeat and PH domain-containing protein 3 [Dermatophagoides pteronyssinus]|uniref:Arf-GAP with GTPase, ANK repeat and PH domain-containing protein 3 n=1 Tax=Dermatophagoides pteronyssinus TaxID=6956 RepID=A0ABQ8JDS2_DERPT|nr:Arf-GAP with GTPase, ANK repeat and PH domain-containing protein 3 [Dermatophagoides pteronyssinus]
MSRESLNENIPATSQTRPSSSTSIVSSSSFGGCGPSSLTSSTCYYNNSLAIRQEIQRFESVHPSIYAIYDLLELIGGADGQLIAQRVRDHVVCIEDSFVNSQEWTLSRSVPDLRIGVVGTYTSGKSALVHRYLTGSYLQDESPEGGRFKKEVIIDGQSYLLLIRDEGGPPEMQLSCWVDAVIFVFSLENEASFQSIMNYYTRMFHLRSNNDIPILLVGTQDAISDTNPRVIDESRARKLAQELKRCVYYEACATYGSNVDKIFQTACHRIIQNRNAENINSRPATPASQPLVNKNFSTLSQQQSYQNKAQPILTGASSPPLTSVNLNIINGKVQPQNSSPSSVETNITENNLDHIKSSIASSSVLHNLVMKKPAIIGEKPKLTALYTSNHPMTEKKPQRSIAAEPISSKRNVSLKYNNNNTNSNDNDFKVPDSPTPVPPSPSTSVHEATFKNQQVSTQQTPNTNRKNRRKSNLFTPLSNKTKNDDKYKNGEVGSGRTIPIKQGYLYKKSKKTLNKDWKKKYVTLTTDGCLTYHPTLHDYMDDVHGKNIPLKHTTVKIPGQKPRCGARPLSANSPAAFNSVDSNRNYGERRIPSTNPKYDPSSGKKQSRKIKNPGAKNGEIGDDNSDGNEFVIVSLDNKQWHFNASNADEREEWIAAIEQQILSSLQNSEYDKSKLHNVNSVDDSAIHTIRTVPGNKYCVDCEAPNPDWASLNLGSLICIECSGIHRNLGTHISKVRSLGLDVWPSSHVSVMLGLGNTAVNEIWEYQLKSKTKPTPTSRHEEKERFIRAKYERREFLAPLDDQKTPIQTQLINSVMKMDIKQIVHLLAHASFQNLNLSQIFAKDKKTLLHLAASRGCLEITQLLIWATMDIEGKTALFYAKIAGHKEIEELLNQQNSNSNQFDDNQLKTSLAPKNAVNNNNHQNSNNNENIALNLNYIENFNKLPASII